MRSPNFNAIENLDDNCIVSPKTAADYLGCTSAGVRQRILRGNIPATKVGGRYWIKGRDLKMACLPVIV
jgi:excisionase family DNA binding protein